MNLGKIYRIDNSRNLIVFDTKEDAIEFSSRQFAAVVNSCNANNVSCNVSLSGGSTPMAIYKEITKNTDLPWDNINLFFGDERSVGPSSNESNYNQSLNAGFKNVIPTNNIHRMVAETDIENNALKYCKLLQKELHDGCFDLMLLGMGDDGHTASLFPNAPSLSVKDSDVIFEFVEAKLQNRMSLSLPCINRSKNISVYVFGENKADMLCKVLFDEKSKSIPCSLIGTPQTPALFIVDKEAAMRCPLESLTLNL